jgi:hypothetical protein
VLKECVAIVKQKSEAANKRHAVLILIENVIFSPSFKRGSQLTFLFLS